MNQRPRCSDVAEVIVNYFRQECAVTSSNGIETSTDKLGKAIGASQTSVASHLRRLLDFGIIILKSGVHEHGSKNPKFFTLGEGHEEGNEWKRIYYGNQAPMPLKKNPPILPSDIVRASAKAASDKTLLEELVQTYGRIKELQEMVLTVQRKRDDALATAQRQATRIQELEEDLKLESESAHRSQQDITTLELNLREVRGQVASHDRQIAKSDQRVPQFAHR